MYQVEYTALKYYNSVVTGECMCVGMLYNNLTTGQRDFRHITNFSRFKAFDDEADTNFVKLYLQGIKNSVENNIFNFQSFDLSGFTRFYVNEFKFSEIITINIPEDENYIDNLTKIYLKFDFNKRQRLKISEEKRYIKQILKSKSIQFSKPKVNGGYNEEINFDYRFDNIGVKLFSFDKKKNLKKLIPVAKQWSFTAEELEKEFKTIFIYEASTMDNDNLDIILKILKKHADVYQLDEGLEFLLKQLG